MNSLRELLVTGLELLHGAHMEAAQQMAALGRTSTHPRLKTAVAMGTKQNRQQMKRLGKVFKAVQAQAGGRGEAVMQGIIAANNKALAETLVPGERDLVNIAFGQTAAHFYITRYGTLRAYAEELGYRKAAKLLGVSLREAEMADRQLSRVAAKVMAGIERPERGPSALGVVLSAVTGVGAVAALAATVTYGRGLGED